ncbi:MAG: hypothetical protein LIP09_13720 [Bacteroidales bacterium]|nr:hypothetical protein [Bacteroidales bacterium]
MLGYESKRENIKGEFAKRIRHLAEGMSRKQAIQRHDTSKKQKTASTPHTFKFA